jgi:hypothetical protein
MIMADAAGKGGRAETGGGDKGERIVGAILREIVLQRFVILAVTTFHLERAAVAKFLEVYGGVMLE